MTAEVLPPRSLPTSSFYMFLQGVVGSIMIVFHITFATRILSVVEIGVVAALGMTSTLFTAFGTFAARTPYWSFLNN